MTCRSVLISGAGIAGPTLAYWLRKAGTRCTLVERAPRLRDGGYVIDFWGLGYEIATRMGLQPALNRFGYHVRELRIVGDDGHRLAGMGTAAFDEVVEGRYVTLRRSDLSRLVFCKVMEETEVIFGDEIAGLTQNADHVRVRLANGGERRFDFVIGADGLHSRVRELAFGPENRFEVDLGYAVAAFECAGYPHRDEDAYVMYCLPGRMVGRFLLRDGKTVFLFVTTTRSGRLPSELAEQKKFLHARFAGGKWEVAEILSALERAGALYFDRVSQIHMPCWSQGRIALIGDAAFCVSLTAGQGSALAMLSAYVLAGELAKTPQDFGEAFARYEAFLKPFIAVKQRGAQRFAGMFAPRTRLALWFRNMAMRSFAVPGLAKFSIGRDISDGLALPDYRW